MSSQQEHRVWISDPLFHYIKPPEGDKRNIHITRMNA